MYQIKKTKSMGMGWFATKDIPNQTTILSDETFILKLPKSLVDNYNTDLSKKVVDLEVEKLWQPLRDSFLQLEGNNNIEKLMINGVPLYTDLLGAEAVTEVGIFLEQSRLNHSCKPNAVRAQEKGVMSVVAQKDIKMGEEIFISYLNDNFLTKQQRNEILQLNGMQQCKCDLCCSSQSVIVKSDNRRKQLRQIKQQFLNGKENEFINMLNLMQQEELIMPMMGSDAMFKLMTLHQKEQNTIKQQLDESYAKFDFGARVIIQGLQKNESLNGRIGIISKNYDKKTQRYGVSLENDHQQLQQQIAVKPENLKLFSVDSLNQNIEKNLKIKKSEIEQHNQQIDINSGKMQQLIQTKK